MADTQQSFELTDEQSAWKISSTAPCDRPLELAVIENGETHALIFPCRRGLDGWVNAETNELLARLKPSHWREWRFD